MAVMMDLRVQGRLFHVLLNAAVRASREVELFTTTSAHPVPTPFHLCHSSLCPPLQHEGTVKPIAGALILVTF